MEKGPETESSRKAAAAMSSPEKLLLEKPAPAQQHPQNSSPLSSLASSSNSNTERKHTKRNNHELSREDTGSGSSEDASSSAGALEAGGEQQKPAPHHHGLRASDLIELQKSTDKNYGQAEGNESHYELHHRSKLVRGALEESKRRRGLKGSVKSGLTSQSDSSADSLNRKLPQSSLKSPVDTILFTCPIKSMLLDHNAQTAYFTVGAATRHGQELRCSHLGCQNENGVKFRFCSHCGSPVPARNFWARHNHDNQLPRPKDDHGASLQSGQPSSDIPAQVTTTAATTSSGFSENSKKRPASYDGSDGRAPSKQPKVSSSSSQQESSNLSSETSSMQASNASTSSTKSDGRQSSSKEATSGDTTATGVAKRPPPANEEEDAMDSLPSDPEAASVQYLAQHLGTDSKQFLEWSNLLGKRPPMDSEEQMSAWLLDVIEASDNMKSPLKVSYQMSTTDISNDSSSETRGSKNSSAPTDQSGTAGTSRTDGSSANDFSDPSDRDTNNASTDSNSNDSSNDSSSETQEQPNGANETDP